MVERFLCGHERDGMGTIWESGDSYMIYTEKDLRAAFVAGAICDEANFNRIGWDSYTKRKRERSAEAEALRRWPDPEPQVEKRMLTATATQPKIDFCPTCGTALGVVELSE
jgi:hypothetical protein